MIGNLNTYITILERTEVATRPSVADDTPTSSIDWDGILEHTTGENITYNVIWETWADLTFVSITREYLYRAMGKDTGDTRFITRNFDIARNKDFYIDCEGKRYKVLGVKPMDKKSRYIVFDCNFITMSDDDA